MIRNHEATNPKRRIAVIQIPRPQRARMGSIGNGWPARDTTVAWTTIADEQPDTSANWISYVLMDQARTRETTPGTIEYTPANTTPAQNVAPWNSWVSPNCPGGVQASSGVPLDVANAAPQPVNYDKLFLLFGLVTAAAAATYMVNSATRR